MIICLDITTTGNDIYSDEVLSIEFFKIDDVNYKIIDKIKIDIVDGYIDKEKLKNIISNNIILTHNSQQKIRFLNNLLVDKIDNIIIDTLFLSNIVYYDIECIEFNDLYKELNTNQILKYFKKLVKDFKKLAGYKKELLLFIFNNSNDKHIMYLSELLLTNIEFIKFSYFEFVLLKKIKKITKKNKLLSNFKIKTKNINSYYDKFSNIEKRENQLKMTNTVFDTLNNSKKTTIEAPTGLGKSFAYLIPSIVYSLKHNKQIIVSTKTKALQDQLYYKDLDFLEKNLGEDFRYTKLKGKNNYICISLFFDEIALSDFDYIKTGFLSKITLWLCDTKFGDFDELKFLNKEYFYKQLISADTYNIKTNTLINDYSSYEFITKAKNRVEESNIIIVNHNLLFSDLVGDYSFLGDIKNIIFDEGHSLEDVVTNALIKGFSLKNVKSIIDIVDKTFNKLSIKKITFIKLTSEIISYLELLEDYGYNYIDNYKNIEIGKYTHILIKDDFFKSIDYKSVLKKIELSFIDLIDLLANKREHDFTKEKRFFENNLDSIKKILNFDESNSLIKTIKYSDINGIFFEYTYLKPGDILYKKLWPKLDSCILTSATLKINNKIDYFKKILRLDDFEFKCFESDFNYKKQATVFIPNDLGGINENQEIILNFLLNLFNIIKGNTLMLFTSFYSINLVLNYLSNQKLQQNINILAQGSMGNKNRLIKIFNKSYKNSILLGTNSFWEGVDISGNKLKFLVIYKLPFNVPNDPIFEARSSLYSNSFLEYAIPKAIIRLKQGVGRLIRTKSDKGIIIFLDNRIINNSWGNELLSAFPKNINIKIGQNNKILDILKKSKKSCIK